MPSPMLIVRSTVILSTTAIAALSITTFYKLGYAYHYFPYLPSGGEHMYGPINPDTEHWDSYLKPMTLIYDGSTEVCAWVATGISIVAAVIIVIIEAVRVCRSQGGGKSNEQGLSKAMGIIAVAWAATAFVVSCIVAIYANAHYHKLKKTCNFVDEPGRRYTCTWELSTCELEPKWAWYSRVDYGRGFVCEETVSPLFGEVVDGSWELRQNRDSSVTRSSRLPYSRVWWLSDTARRCGWPREGKREVCLLRRG